MDRNIPILKVITHTQDENDLIFLYDIGMFEHIKKQISFSNISHFWCEVILLYKKQYKMNML